MAALKIFCNGLILVSLEDNWFTLGGREFYLNHFERVCSWDLKYGGLLKVRLLTLEKEMRIEWQRATRGDTKDALGNIMRATLNQFAPQFPSYGQTREGNLEAKSKLYEKKGGKKTGYYPQYGGDWSEKGGYPSSSWSERSGKGPYTKTSDKGGKKGGKETPHLF